MVPRRWMVKNEMDTVVRLLWFAVVPGVEYTGEVYATPEDRDVLMIVLPMALDRREERALGCSRFVKDVWSVWIVVWFVVMLFAVTIGGPHVQTSISPVLSHADSWEISELDSSIRNIGELLHRMRFVDAA